MKIAVIGTGHVGSSLAYALVLKGLGNHLLLANRDGTKALGNALDLQHSLAFCERPMQIEGGSLEEAVCCNIVVVTASEPMTKGMTSRMELGKANVELFRSLIPMLVKNNPEAVFIVVTNPVDVMTCWATRLSGLPSSKVVGIGTLVDSARFRTLLSKAERIHPDDLRAYILGEHGPNQFPVFSHALAGGEPITDSPRHRAIFEEVNKAGFEVYQLKGYTNFAIASAACEVIRTIVHDEHRTMPLSTCFDDWQGIKDNCFSIPVVLGRSGIIRYLQPDLNSLEREALEQSARTVRANIDSLLPGIDEVKG